MGLGLAGRRSNCQNVVDENRQPSHHVEDYQNRKQLAIDLILQARPFP